MTLLLLSLHVWCLHSLSAAAEALRCGTTRRATCRLLCHVLLYELNSSWIISASSHRMVNFVELRGAVLQCRALHTDPYVKFSGTLSQERAMQMLSRRLSVFCYYHFSFKNRHMAISRCHCVLKCFDNSFCLCLFIYVFSIHLRRNVPNPQVVCGTLQIHGGPIWPPPFKWTCTVSESIVAKMQVVCYKYKVTFSHYKHTCGSSISFQAK